MSLFVRFGLRFIFMFFFCDFIMMICIRIIFFYIVYGFLNVRKIENYKKKISNNIC